MQEKKFPLFAEAFLEAMLIDAPVVVLLGANPVLPILGATVAYSYRKYCNTYLDEYFNNSSLLSHQLLKAAACGIPGGAMKYGIKDAMSGWDVLGKMGFGAVNNFMYELSKNVCADNQTCNNLRPVFIESSESVIDAFASERSLYPNALNGAKVGALIAFSVNTIYAPISSCLKSQYNKFSAVMHTEVTNQELGTSPDPAVNDGLIDDGTLISVDDGSRGEL